MSEFNASAFVTNIERILPKVAERRAACTTALAREAYEGLERELNYFVSCLASEHENTRDGVQFYIVTHDAISLLPDRIVKVEVEDGEFLPSELYRDTSVAAGDLEGLRDFLIQLHKECELRFIPRYVRMHPVSKA